MPRSIRGALAFAVSGALVLLTPWLEAPHIFSAGFGKTAEPQAIKSADRANAGLTNLKDPLVLPSSTVGGLGGSERTEDLSLTEDKRETRSAVQMDAAAENTDSSKPSVLPASTADRSPLPAAPSKGSTAARKTIINSAVSPSALFDGKKVLILGAGIGGLTAAHELGERGFDVTVVESWTATGGKARSVDVPASASTGGQNLPGEHGFRIFPSFYHHLNDTLQRVPGPDGRPAIHQLYLPEVAWFARDQDREPMGISTGGRYSGGISEFLRMADSMTRWHGASLSHAEALTFAKKMLYLLTSSRGRRLAELEFLSWWDYLEADAHSDTYQKLFALGTARTLLAMKPTVASARIVGEMFGQFWQSVNSSSGGADRMLMGPSNTALFDPWQRYLEDRFKTRFVFNTEVAGFNMQDGKIESVVVRDRLGDRTLKADHYLSALPLDVMRRLLTTEMLESAPGLSKLSELHIEPMIGLQIYLKAEVPLPTSHAFLLDSPWAIALVYNQTQVWRDYSLSHSGDGTIQSVVSITFGDVHQPGILFGKPLAECTKDEILREAVAQIDRHLGTTNAGFIAKNLRGYHFDPAVRFDGNRTWSAEPLFINSVGSYYLRPKAQTEIANLVLSADYVLGEIEVSSTMEAANLAGRNAAIAVLRQNGWAGSFPRLFRLEEHAAFMPLKALDAEFFRVGWLHPLAYLLGRPPRPSRRLLVPDSGER